MYLMGIDENGEKITVTKEEKKLFDNYNKLNDLGKKEANKRISELTEIPKYTKDIDIYEEPLTVAAHDDNLTNEEIDFMDKCIEEHEKNK